ncbi:MAG TPA: class I adenylate-forming enzyme family protein [Beijerinckiaceae bacterium]|nr:class I adenylate-forming enzyme family protein [Beijerinckiaceae bacterium]
MSNTILTLLNAQRLDEFYASGFWRDQTIYAVARQHAEAAPDRFAVRDRLRRISYGDLLARADAFADDLQRQGVRAGQRVAVWLPSRIEVAVALLACSRNGYICCPSLHRDHTMADVAALVRRMRAAALVTEAGYGADGADIVRELNEDPGLLPVYRLDPLAREAQLQAGRALPGLAPGAAPLREPPPADPNRVVYLAFTSGTTGVPKGVMHSDNTLLANARAIAADWALGQETVIYSMSPLSHNLGFGALVTALLVGGELVVHDLPKGAPLLDRILEVEATYLVGVPTHAIDLLEELRKRGLTGLGAVKGFRISGASAPKEVVAELLRYGVVPQSGYGMTEASSHHYTLPTDDPRLIVETSGRVCPGYEIRIWSQDNPDVEVPTGQIGQIGGRGASLMLGYFDDQAATEDSFNAHGWFMTGDLGWVDEAGYLRVTGRKKDLIIRGGHNIYPAKIENLAMQHEAVERAAAVPVADMRLGEKVCLAVMLRAGREVSGAQLLEHLDASGLSRYDMPEYFLQLDEIPLTASGKILKRDLVSSIQEGRLTPTPIRWQPRA